MLSDFKLPLLLLAFTVGIVATCLLWQSGLIAPVLLLLIGCILLAWRIWRRDHQQQQQSVLVLKALANQDSTLSLPGNSPLQQLLQQVQTQLMTSRQQAEDKAQYLQTLISQLDIAVLEFDATDRLLQANPAAQRLLCASQFQQLQTGHAEDPSLHQLLTLVQACHSHFQGQLVWQQPGFTDRLAISIVCTRLQRQSRKLVTLQSINQALLQQEVQAYQQLTRVLTHEIANSVTPMVSLAQSGLQLLPAAGQALTTEDRADLRSAFDTINRRSQHLSQFILSFKQLSQPVQPELQRVDLVNIIHSCLALQRELRASQNVTLQLHLPEQAMLWLDPALMEQVLINLLQNALDAMQSSQQKTLQLTLHAGSRQQWYLDIADTGPGINPQVAAQIFIPFFTTKAQGSGIGLSLARALLQVQDAQLQLLPDRASGSCFRIAFNGG